MHRSVRILLVGSVLLTAACGTTGGPPATGPAAAPAPGAPVPGVSVGGAPAAGGTAAAAAQPELKGTCEALGQVYDKNMAPLAEALTKMVAGRKGATGTDGSQQQAQQALKSFATAVRGATQASVNAQLRADGKQAADRLQARSTDAAFFGKIRTPEDVNTLLGPTLKEWLSPIAHHCS